MKKLYDSNNIQYALGKILPSHFRVVNDKTSNGYRFFNSLYGILYSKLWTI